MDYKAMWRELYEHLKKWNERLDRDLQFEKDSLTFCAKQGFISECARKVDKINKLMDEKNNVNYLIGKMLESEETKQWDSMSVI